VTSRQPDTPEGYVAELKKRQNVKALIDLIVPISVREYDVPTLEATVAFAETGAGKKFLATQDRLTNERGEIFQKWATDISTSLLVEMHGK
jgi:hypothetical protein